MWQKLSIIDSTISASDMYQSASASLSLPASFQLPSVQQVNEGKCQKAANQDMTDAKYVVKYM